MAANKTNEVKKSQEEPVANNKIKGLLKIAEVRMLLYIIPVALVLLVVAILLNK